MDTGASDIIINPNVLDQSIGGWDLIDRLVGHSLQLASRMTAPILGRGVVRMEFGGLDANVVVCVAEVCDHCLLGMSFLVQHDCQLDRGQGHMWLGTERLQLVGLGDNEEVQRTWLQVRRNATVPPRSETLVMAELAAGAHHIGQLGLMGPWSSQGAEGLMVGRTLVDTRGPMLAV